ncbi:MAG: cell division protein FtsK [Streptomyces sp.]|nr:cell division protein FtsK [Streptomyces sp.]
MDWQGAWNRIGSGANSTRAVSVNALDSVSLSLAPAAARWDAEADRRRQLRTPENLKKLMDAQRAHNSARSTAATAKSQRRVARASTRNPLAGTRRAARTADRAASKQADTAKADVKAARKNYPATLASVVARIHAAHATAAGLASWVLTEHAHALTLWPAEVSAATVAAQVGALYLGRRQVTVEVEDGVSAEERRLMERLDPSFWVQHAEERGLSGTVTTPPSITSAGIECDVRLDGQWTVKKLRAAADSIRALLGARTDLPMLVAAGPRGGWAVIRLRTRSAAPDGAIPWRPGDAFGVDMVTGEDVRVPLGQRMLIAGMSGAGKSVTSRPLLFEASEGPTSVLVVIDLKMVEGRLWDHRARVAFAPEQVIALVDELVEELTERLEVLPKGQATLVPTAERPRITVVVDEGAEVMSACSKVPTVVGYTDKGAEITRNRDALEGLDSIARMGRAACIDLWWMTQSPTYGDGVPRQIAKQLGVRLGLAVESPTEARVVFGESAQEKGWKADELPMPGVVMVRDGKRSPDPVKVRFMTDGDVIALPDMPIWSREEHGADAPAESARPALRLVKDDDASATPAAAVPAPRSEAEQAVVDAVRAAGAPVRQKDLVTTTGLAKGTVSKVVARLVDAGALVRTEDGALTVAAGEVSA